MLPVAVEHYRRQQEITLSGVSAARRARRQSPAAVELAVARYQLLAAQEGIAGVDLMLAAQGIAFDPAGEVVPVSLAGVASDGRPLGSLLQQATTDAQFAMIVATQLQDVGRVAAGVAVAAQPSVGYVRMMNPPSCSRCAVLAGKWFKWNTGFQRHPNCDCRHIPALEADYQDLALSGDKWFHSLPTDAQVREQYPTLTRKMRNEAGVYSQEDIFTKAGAQAIRDGADLNQVVNARRGMAPAQIFGRDVTITREGVTRRGLYGSSDASFAAGYDSRRVGRRGYIANSVERTTKRTRLMPETIYQIAKDRADAQRLLKLYGFII